MRKGKKNQNKSKIVKLKEEKKKGGDKKKEGEGEDYGSAGEKTGSKSHK